MDFESPRFLWGFAVLGLIAALHLLRHRTKPRVEPSLIIWRKLMRRMTAGGRSAGTPPPVEMPLALAFASSLVLAAAGPFMETSEPPPLRALFLLDRSASMKCPFEQGLSRHGRAIELMSAAAALLGPGDSITVRGFPPFREGDIECGAGGFDSIASRIPPPTDAEAFPSQAVSRGLAAFAGPEGRVFLFSDGAYPPELGPGPGVRLCLCGDPAENLAVTALGVSRDQGGAWQVFAEISSFGSAKGAVQVELRDCGSGDVLESASAVLAPGGFAGVVFGEGRMLDIGNSGAIEVRLRGSDALRSDDSAFAARSRRPLRATFQGTDAPFLKKALEASGLVEFAGDGHRDGTEIAVFHGVEPDRDPDACAVIVDPPEGSGRFEVSKATAARDGGFEAASSAPGLAGPARRISVSGYRKIGPREGWSFLPVVVFGTDTAAAVFRRAGGGPVSVVAGLPVNPEDAPWVWDPEFPLFWAEIVRIAFPGADAAGRAGFAFDRTGAVVRAGLRTGTSPVEVRGPDGRIERMDSGPVPLVLERAGLYEIRTGSATELVAANLLSRAESAAGGRTISEMPESRRPGEGAGVAAPLRLGNAFGILGLMFLGAIILFAFRRRRPSA